MYQAVAYSGLTGIRGRDMYNEPHGSDLSKVNAADRGWGCPCQRYLRCLSMDFEFQENQRAFKSNAQNARVWTEQWVLREMYCPACGNHHLENYPNNRPVADFFCGNCDEQFELKSTKSKFGKKITDGAYETMIARLHSSQVPNLMLLRYDMERSGVEDISVVPQQFFTPDLIEKRKPLAATARRAGWVGCNILIHRIPKIGRIELVKERQVASVKSVVEQWERTKFLKSKSLESRGWVMDVLNCVQELGMSEFSLADVYQFENFLSELHPANNNVRPKIRQQLQVLRDAGLVSFLGKGQYKLLG